MFLRMRFVLGPARRRVGRGCATERLRSHASLCWELGKFRRADTVGLLFFLGETAGFVR